VSTFNTCESTCTTCVPHISCLRKFKVKSLAVSRACCRCRSVEIPCHLATFVPLSEVLAKMKGYLWTLFHREETLLYVVSMVYAWCRACTPEFSFGVGSSIRAQLTGNALSLLGARPQNNTASSSAGTAACTVTFIYAI
jgi:hypothetical protein